MNKITLQKLVLEHIPYMKHPLLKVLRLVKLAYNARQAPHSAHHLVNGCLFWQVGSSNTYCKPTIIDTN